MSFKITGVGSYLPSKVVTNDDLEKLLETNNEWIISRTGISKRHIAAENEFTSDLALKAAEEAIINSNINKAQIDLVICATTTPDFTFPSLATVLCKKLGIANIPAFDVQAVCAGFIYGIHIAESFMKCGIYKNILLVGAEKMSNLVDWQDRGTAILFGDGAGAVILSKDTNNFVDSFICADGMMSDILATDNGPGSFKSSGVIKMEGKQVFKHAVEKMPKAVDYLLEKNNLTSKDIDYLICHQANLRIIDNIQNHIGIDEDKVIKTVNFHANCSAASIPLALDYLYKQNKLQSGQLVAFSAIGAGLTWGSALVRW